MFRNPGPTGLNSNPSYFLILSLAQWIRRPHCDLTSFNSALKQAASEKRQCFIYDLGILYPYCLSSAIHSAIYLNQ